MRAGNGCCFVLAHADFLTHVNQVTLNTIELAQFLDCCAVAACYLAQRIALADGCGFSSALVAARFAASVASVAAIAIA